MYVYIYIYIGNTGIMEKKMETIVMGYTIGYLVLVRRVLHKEVSIETCPIYAAILA